MKFIFENKTEENTHVLLRRAGYKPHSEGQSYVRPLSQDPYPRFHLYINEAHPRCEIRLHLDQRRPRYKNAPAHCADYQSSVLQKEAARLQQIFAINEVHPRCE